MAIRRSVTGSRLDVDSPGSDGSSNDWSRKDEDRSKDLVRLLKDASPREAAYKITQLKGKSSAWMALARLGKAAPYSTLTFLLLAPAGISDRLGFELTAHQPY